MNGDIVRNILNINLKKNYIPITFNIKVIEKTVKNAVNVMKSAI